MAIEKKAFRVEISGELSAFHERHLFAQVAGYFTALASGQEVPRIFSGGKLVLCERTPEGWQLLLTEPL